VCRLSRQSSKLSNFSEKGTHRHDGRATINTCIAESSMCIEHIINLVQHWVKHSRRRDSRAAIDMCIADSLMYIEHIINPVRHQVKHSRRCDGRAAIDTCIADSSMCIEHINPVRYRVKLSRGDGAWGQAGTAALVRRHRPIR
jgi:hypothetical protein